MESASSQIMPLQFAEVIPVGHEKVSQCYPLGWLGTSPTGQHMHIEGAQNTDKLVHYSTVVNRMRSQLSGGSSFRISFLNFGNAVGSFQWYSIAFGRVLNAGPRGYVQTYAVYCRFNRSMEDFTVLNLSLGGIHNRWSQWYWNEIYSQYWFFNVLYSPGKECNEADYWSITYEPEWNSHNLDIKKTPPCD